MISTTFNYKRDTKRNEKASKTKFNKRDHCQSPPYAVVPVLPYVPEDSLIWEPAVGEGYMAESLRKNRRPVVTSGLKENFFHYNPDNFDVIVTNPPWSIKYAWIERCLELGKPFALLLHTETIATVRVRKFYDQYGLEYIQPTPRIDYKMPNKGWGGKGAQFPSIWITHGLNIGEPFSYVDISGIVGRFKQWVKSGGEPRQFCLF